jgi:predicted ABC-type sugar transport system permease subunit
LWVGDNASAQRSVGVAIALVLLHVSIVSILLIALWIKRRASRRSARGAVTEGR